VLIATTLFLQLKYNTKYYLLSRMFRTTLEAYVFKAVIKKVVCHKVILFLKISYAFIGYCIVYKCTTIIIYRSNTRYPRPGFLYFSVFLTLLDLSGNTGLLLVRQDF
jgi:hypothetical protein